MFLLLPLLLLLLLDDEDDEGRETTCMSTSPHVFMVDRPPPPPLALIVPGTVPPTGFLEKPMRCRAFGVDKTSPPMSRRYRGQTTKKKQQATIADVGPGGAYTNDFNSQLRTLFSKIKQGVPFTHRECHF